MDFDRVAWASPASGHRVRHGDHSHVVPPGLSRRAFLRVAAGAGLAGAATASGAIRPRLAAAAAPGIGNVLPIPTTLEIFGEAFHLQAPGFTAPDTDPSTVYNFKGAAGIAFVSGMVDRRDRRTGEVRTLPFLFNDMRFMQGVYTGRDGHTREATFAFV